MIKAHRIVIAAAIGAALFIFGGLIRAADTPFPIYFQDSKLIVKADVMNRTVYLPIKEIVSHLNLPYTDSVALETLTIRSGNNQLVVTKNSALISFNGQIILLPSPILREDGRWLAPVDFLTLGLTKMTSTDFRYHSGTSRLFAGVEAPELEMNAQTLGPITRLTLRSARPINIDVKREETRAVLSINVNPLDPLRERIDHKDRLLRSVTFDDSDGTSKIVLETTRDVSDIRVTAADNNRIFFVDLLRKGESVTAVQPASVEPPANTTSKPDAVPQERRVRVIVIDPGHGGMDTGVKTAAGAEKDITLALARRLRLALQTRLGGTVLLTRESDVDMDNEARSAVANNNLANLLISLHVGYSADKRESTSSIFIMKDDFGHNATPASARDTLFLPWYLGYRTHRQGSATAATMLQEELLKAIPGSPLPIRTAPLAVLSSATMPAVLLETGNLNNTVNAQTLSDSEFQTRFSGAIVNAIQRFSESPKAAAK